MLLRNKNVATLVKCPSSFIYEKLYSNAFLEPIASHSSQKPYMARLKVNGHDF